MHENEHDDGYWIYAGSIYVWESGFGYDLYRHSLSGLMKKVWVFGTDAGRVEIYPNERITYA